ncbi:putative Ig domain-containing protein [Psychrosphaera algicola]|uniref:Ig domain-containing protein n=1 Tax=Psychrosphaera algicola TaxID=3023714 RepID=A0ABT5FER3_9GAMM|nr:putative Ig domain-containing protein [Psychrosphaera sp. G1-22]MDC2890024.1 putative Ig domain-containing protein [Psychrosphaera sp. G1-22]
MDLVKTIDYQIITPLFPLELKTKQLNQAIVGQSFSQQIDVFGALPPYQFSSSALPDGLTLTEDGLLAGTPTSTGDFEIELSIKAANGTTLTSKLALPINNKSDFDTLFCSTIVDFGDSLEASDILDGRFDTIILDKYTSFVNFGTAITTGDSGAYNYQGVKAIENVSLNIGDVVRLIWFNSGDSDILFSPKISFNDADRVSSDDDEIWHTVDEVRVKANHFGVSQFIITESTDASVINVNNNYDNNNILVMDRIELVQPTKLLTDVCLYPFVEF